MLTVPSFRGRIQKVQAAAVPGFGVGGYWYCIAERPVPALHLAHPERCAALRIVLVTLSRSCEHFPVGFDLHLLHCRVWGECPCNFCISTRFVPGGCSSGVGGQGSGIYNERTADNHPGS